MAWSDNRPSTPPPTRNVIGAFRHNFEMTSMNFTGA